MEGILAESVLERLDRPGLTALPAVDLSAFDWEDGASADNFLPKMTSDTIRGNVLKPALSKPALSSSGSLSVRRNTDSWPLRQSCQDRGIETDLEVA